MILGFRAKIPEIEQKLNDFTIEVNEKLAKLK